MTIEMAKNPGCKSCSYCRYEEDDAHLSICLEKKNCKSDPIWGPHSVVVYCAEVNKDLDCPYWVARQPSHWALKPPKHYWWKRLFGIK